MVCYNSSNTHDHERGVDVSERDSSRYVPRVNSRNMSSANPVDGIWCSHCGWAGVIAQDITDFDEYSEPQFDSLAEDVPTFCPKCGSLLMY